MTPSPESHTAEFVPPEAALDTVYTYLAARLVWAKTREKTKRALDPDALRLEIGDVFHMALGFDLDYFVETAAEETYLSMAPEHLAKAISTDPTQALEVFLWLLEAQGTPTQQQDFLACRRKIGRHPNVKPLILAMNKLLLQFGVDLSYEGFEGLQVPKPLYQVAHPFRQALEQTLLQWALPRTSELEDLFRRFIAENPLPDPVDPELLPLQEFPLQRKSPPLHQLFSKTTRLKIFKALTPLREWTSRRSPEQSPPTPADKATLEKLMNTAMERLREILAPSRPILVQHRVSLDDLCLDCLVFDSQLSKEEMLA